jgi:pimeloyl-ACP methyl ester carboxylesterase
MTASARSKFGNWNLLGIWNLGFGASRKIKCSIAAIVLFTTTAAVCAGDLPHKSKAPRESYPNIDVIYDSVTAPDGNRLRTIITKPRNARGKLPVIFVAGWLSCDSVEAPAGTKDESGLVFRGLAQLPQFVLFRMDKQGVGDSEGVCSETDFDSELAAYRAAFRAMKNYDFIDTKKIYILGISNGGGFAPLVPESDTEQAQVGGYISVGGWVKTWFEHMLEIERRRFGLMGKSPGEVNDRMKSAATLYHEWLIKHRTLDDIVKEQPQLGDLWPEGKDHAHLYGRPLAFYEQLQKLNLADAWSRVKAPTYVLRGVFDWIMSREDSELIAMYVNRNGDLAFFYEIPSTGHTFQHYLSLADAFKNKRAQFDPKLTGLLTDWLSNKAITHED